MQKMRLFFLKNGEIIQENRINDETTVKLNEIIKKYNLYAQYYQGEECFIVNRSSYTQTYEDITTFDPIVIGEKCMK